MRGGWRWAQFLPRERLSEDFVMLKCIFCVCSHFALDSCNLMSQPCTPAGWLGQGQAEESVGLALWGSVQVLFQILPLPSLPICHYRAH